MTSFWWSRERQDEEIHLISPNLITLRPFVGKKYKELWQRTWQNVFTQGLYNNDNNDKHRFRNTIYQGYGLFAYLYLINGQTSAASSSMCVFFP